MDGDATVDMGVDTDLVPVGKPRAASAGGVEVVVGVGVEAWSVGYALGLP
jgi:hypothetical protein